MPCGLLEKVVNTGSEPFPQTLAPAPVSPKDSPDLCFLHSKNDASNSIMYVAHTGGSFCLRLSEPRWVCWGCEWL